MSTIKIENVREYVEGAGWQLISEEYINLKTDLQVKCPEGHDCFVSFEKFRKGYDCPICKQNQYYKTDNIAVKKNGFRTLAFDQASITSGWAVFDDETLVKYGKWTSDAIDSTSRIAQTKCWIASMIEKWKPDQVVLEDIQLQKIDGQGEAVLTYKKLAHLQGVISNYLYEKSIDFLIVPAATWRAHSEIKGRAIENNEKIPTPEGWKKIKDIQIGDFLFDAQGVPTKVLNIFPQKQEEIYLITFKDGRKIKCTKDHLWSFNTKSQKEDSKKNRKFYTKSTEEILKNFQIKKGKTYNILIPVNSAVSYNKKNHSIPPYVLGLLLGDGCLRTSHNGILQFSSKNDELPNKIAILMDWHVKHSESNYTYWFSDKEDKNIKVENLFKDYPQLINTSSQTKFIPQEYLQGSIEDRLSLLQGLLDTDGCVTTGGRVNFSTISPLLKDNIKELCQSLGLIVNITEIPPRGYGKKESFNIHIMGKPEIKKELFQLREKKEKMLKWFNSSTNKNKYDFNPIIKIERINEIADCTCFEVDNNENLFLVGDFIVTHNCRTDKKKNAQLKIKRFYDVSVTQDEADAILIGRWAAHKVKATQVIEF